MSQIDDCTEIMLSIMVITYNHERYLRAALDSIVEQQTVYSMEVVIGEDCSTDTTRVILLEYQARHPSLIRLLLHEQNLGVSHNWETTLQACRGKYIALLEGDDYWTSPHKLQKQIDFLEARPDFSLCFHRTRVEYEATSSVRASPLVAAHAKTELTLDDVTREWSIATASVVFRHELMRELPGWVHDSVVVDLPVFALLASRGRVGYLPEEMAVYRVNTGGVTNTAQQENFLLGLAHMHKRLNQELGFAYHYNLSLKISNNYASLAGLMNNEGKYKAARRYLWQAWRTRAGQGVRPGKEEAKILAVSLLPRVLLRQVQLEINKLRIKTIDKWRFPEQALQPGDFVIRRDELPFQYYQVKTAHLDARLRQQFEHENRNWTQDEYLLVYEQPCIIEPNYGWALSAENRLIYPSLGFSRVPYLPRPATRAKDLRDAPLEEYAELVSLRDTGEENYFHFYNDVLAKLFFLEEKLGLSLDVPLLVSKRLYDRPYFQYFLAHPYLRDRRWVVQDAQYIRSHRTYFCKPLTHTSQYYRRILDMVRPEDRAVIGSRDRRLFITRSPRRLRFIENNAEVAGICQELGFDILDFDELTLSEQIQAVGQARYVVGIHGAGLANILFRGGQPLGLLEIYPPATYFPFHYIILANQLGYQYDGLIGLAGSQKFLGGFRVDPTALRQRLAALLQH